MISYLPGPTPATMAIGAMVRVAVVNCRVMDVRRELTTREAGLDMMDSGGCMEGSMMRK